MMLHNKIGPDSVRLMTPSENIAPLQRSRPDNQLWPTNTVLFSNSSDGQQPIGGRPCTLGNGRLPAAPRILQTLPDAGQVADMQRQQQQVITDCFRVQNPDANQRFNHYRQ